MDNREIHDFLGTDEILAQLAEECSELAQAALKLRRCIVRTNPTRTNYPEALCDFQEEWADVLLTIRQTDLLNEQRVYEIMRYKHGRWLESLIHLEQQKQLEQLEQEKRRRAKQNGEGTV